MTFQVSNTKDYNFMNLLNKNSNPIKLYTAKDSPQLKFFGHSNLLCARATRAIVNHAPIGEYQLRFFFQKEFKCLYGLYYIESRHHILHECKCFNNYWNLNRKSIAHFTLFLEFNSSTFSFDDNTTQSGYKYSSFYSFFLYFYLFICLFFFFSLFSTLHVVCISMYVVMKQLSQSAYVLCIINC